MTKRFTPNLSAVSAGIPLLDDGSYEFSIGEPKAFARTTQKNGIDVELSGITVSFKVVEGPSHINKNIPQSFYLSNEDAQPMIKQFLMAAYGFGKASEAGFNEQFSNGEDYAYDAETQEMGEVWRGLAGKRILAEVVSKPSKQDPNQMQNRFTWAPF